LEEQMHLDWLENSRFWKSGVAASQLVRRLSTDAQAAALGSKLVMPVERGPAGMVYVMGFPAR